MTKELKNLLVFGYGFSLIFLFIAYRVNAHHGLNAWVVLLKVLAVVFLVLSITRSPYLKKTYDFWMKITLPIGIFMTGLILVVLFFAVFGIVGIALRLLRKDPLDRSYKNGQASFWIAREKVVFDKENYKRQF